VDTETVDKIYPSGLAGYFHPVNDKLVLGISVFTPSGLGAKWDGADLTALSAGKAYDWLSFIGTITVAPSVSYQVSEMVSVGASLNINYGFFSISRHAGETQTPFGMVDLGQYEEDSTGLGFGATVGVLVKPSDMFSFGLTVRTPTKVSMSGETTISNVSVLGFAPKSEFDRDVTSPLWIAGGIAIKPIENLTITADAHYTNWETLDELDTVYADAGWKAFMAQSGGDKLKLNWANKTQLRFGAEYVVDKFAFRAGYYNDPAPAPDETLTILVPNFDFTVFTGGFGYSSNGITFNVAFEYLTGDERNITATLDNMPGIHGMKIFTAIAGFSYGW
jgi:long-chain fatty acid transport protein